MGNAAHVSVSMQRFLLLKSCALSQSQELSGILISLSLWDTLWGFKHSIPQHLPISGFYQRITRAIPTTISVFEFKQPPNW